MESVRGRLSLGLLASLVLVFLAQWALVSVAIQRVTENYIASRLTHEIENLLGALTIAPQQAPTLDRRRINPFYERPFSGHYFRIVNGDRVLRSRSLWDRDLDVPQIEAGERLRMHREGPEGQPLLVLAEGFRKQGVALTVAVAEDLSAVHADIARFQRQYALASAASLIVLVVLAGAVVRRSLAPLERARRSVAQLHEGKVAKLQENVPAEIRPLVREINRMMDLTRQRLERSRTATGNLAHALRTPLTSLARLRDEPALAQHPDLRGELDRQVHAMAALIERELKRARLAGGTVAGVRFVPARELPDLVAALTRMHHLRDLRIETEIAPEAEYQGDREDMLELFGNLLDNACKWARRRVRLQVRPGPGLDFTVEDDGPGVADDDLGALTERGMRLDETTEGHGLGLAIVRDIIEQHGGELHLGRSESLGGLQVVVRLPPPR